MSILNEQMLTTINATADVILFVGILALVVLHKLDKAKAVEKALDSVDTVAQAVQPLVQSTPIAPVVSVIDEIDRAARRGVQAAQQLYSNDPTVDRKKVATDYVHNVVGELGFELSDRVKHIVDLAIEGVYYGFKQFEKADPAPVVDAPATDPVPTAADPAPATTSAAPAPVTTSAAPDPVTTTSAAPDPVTTTSAAPASAPVSGQNQ